MAITFLNPSGNLYDEYYLYANKSWEMAPSGVSFYNLTNAVLQNAPVVVTSSGYETTTATQPWAEISGSGKYEKVGYGYFHLLDSGQYDVSAKEFALHPDSSGKIVFNGILNENVFIEYESGPSGYYIMTSVDYNPLRGEVEGGFVHHSQTTDPASLTLSASKNSVRADGSQGLTLTATLYDEDYDRVPEKTVVFELRVMSAPLPIGTAGVWSELGNLSPDAGSIIMSDASGVAIQLTETTNRRGQCHAHYTTHNRKSGIAEAKAYYQSSSGVFDTASWAQYYFSSDPFTLDLSLLDTLDYLT